jgi:pyridoxamine 5'-phosphate oxidase
MDSTWWNRVMSDSTQWFESLRVSYEQGELNESEVNHNPLDQFNKWLQEAIKNQVPEPNAMVLSTVNKDGQPGARNVLLKSADENGFIFFTNKNSDKAADLKQNPHCTLLFSWLSQHRQVIVKGKAEEISKEESNSYFQTRPYGSRISAWVSNQSQVIKNREELEKKVKEFMDKYPENVPMPDHWGGYLVKPESIEFWQGRPSRLHDRIRFTKKANAWIIERIAP